MTMLSDGNSVKTKLSCLLKTLKILRHFVKIAYQQPGNTISKLGLRKFPCVIFF